MTNPLAGDPFESQRRGFTFTQKVWPPGAEDKVIEVAFDKSEIHTMAYEDLGLQRALAQARIEHQEMTRVTPGGRKTDSARQAKWRMPSAGGRPAQ